MRSLRRGFQRWVRRLGPLAVLVAAAVLLGFGSHAALDWHRHGSPGAGFFHLHAHAGDHHHDHVAHHDEHGHPHRSDLHHEHHHPGPTRHEPTVPDPESPSDRQDGTFTIAFGVAPAPAVVAVETPQADLGGCRDAPFPVLIARDLTLHPWAPRGPPG